MYIGAAIHLVLLILLSQDKDAGILFIILLPFLVLNVIGLILIHSNKIKLGCRLYMIGCAIFIPIGLVGMFGAMMVLGIQKQRQAIPRQIQAK